jgi:hypothetical protein
MRLVEQRAWPFHGDFIGLPNFIWQKYIKSAMFCNEFENLKIS